MAWTLVQYAKADSGSVLAGASLTATFGSPTIAGNLLIAASCGWNGGVTAYTAPAGWVHKGVLQKDNNFATNDISIYENNPGGITSVAVQQDSNGEAHLQLFEFSGNDISSFDGIIQNTVSSLTSFSRNSTTPTRSPDLVLTIINQQTTTITYTAGVESGGGSGQTKINDVSYFYEWDIITGLAPVTPTATYSATNNVAFSIIIFKPTPTLKSFPIVGSATLTINKFAAFPKTIAIVGTGITSLLKKIEKKFALIGSANTILREAKVRFLSFAASSNGKVSILKRIPKDITTSSSGISSIIKIRLRSIAAIGTGTASITKIRAQIINLVGSAKLGVKLTFFKNIKIIGTGVGGVFKTRFKTVAAVSSGIAHLVKTRLKFIKVQSSQIITMNFIRSIAMNLIGSGVSNIKSLRTYLILIKVLTTGSVVTLTRHFTKTMRTSSGGTVVIKVPRLLKKSIAVTGSKILSFLKRVGTGTANGVSYSITSREETDYKIKVK